jgi:hypothetical protein
MAVKNNLLIHHVDVKTAYLNSPLEEEIYMVQPYLFEEGKDKVCKLNRAIYGLKQSAKCWNQRLTRVLIDFGFEQLKSEPCIFVHRSQLLIVGFYVDDLIILAMDSNSLNNFKDQFSTQFEVTDKGPFRCFLNIKVEFKNNEAHLTQTEFIDELLKTHRMTDCKGESTPMITGQDWHSYQESPPIEDLQVYQQIVGSLIYLANSSRPDIQFATGQLCKFMQEARQAHLQAA